MSAPESHRPVTATASGLALTLPREVELAVVERAAQLLADRMPAPLEPLLTVDQVAERLQVSSEWVRRHAAELGAFRLSEGGGRNPIRFRPSDVAAFLAGRRLRPPMRAGRVDWRNDPDWASA